MIDGTHAWSAKSQDEFLLAQKLCELPDIALRVVAGATRDSGT